MTTSTTAQAMRFGQHAITGVLVVIGAVGAVRTDRPWPAFALCALFVVWYVVGVVLARRVPAGPRRTAWLIVLIALWVGLAVLAQEFVWLAFPLWLLTGQLLRLRPAAAVSTAILVVVVVAPIAHTGTVSSAYIIGPFVGGLFAFGISRGYLRLIADARERAQLLTSLVQAQEDMARLHDELGHTQRQSGVLEERTRLSRDIHDTIAQSLSAIVILARADTETSDARATLTRIEAIAADGLVDVRRIVAALTPAQLEEGALVTSMRRMLERLADETGIRTELDADEQLPRLPVAVEIALLRTAQSALSNVRLHSEAGRVVVHVVDAGDSIRLDIVDDGRGFDLAAWSADPGRGYGLRAMRERLRELGGDLDVEAAVESGTALSAHVPIAPVVPSTATEGTS